MGVAISILIDWFRSAHEGVIELPLAVEARIENG